MASIVEILGKKWVGAGWTLENDDYFTLKWFSKDIPMPTEDTIRKYSDEVDVMLEWDEIRRVRDVKLDQTDYTQELDYPNREEWAIYRQELRDIPQTFNTPEEVIWPIPPNLKE